MPEPGRMTPPSGHLCAGVDARDGRPLLFVERRETRLGGALGLSIAIHAVAIVLLLVIGRLAPAADPSEVPDSPLPQLVFISAEGPGGGGGGGGNEMPEPPAQVQLPGEEPLSLPVETAPEPEPETPPEPEPPDPEPPPLQIRMPVATMAAANTIAPGVIESDRASESLGSGSRGGADEGRNGGIGPGEGSGLDGGAGGNFGGDVVGPGSGASDPIPIRKVSPDYTAEALRAKVQGTVVVQCVVRPDGTVSDLEVIRSLDRTFGLDDQALRAASQWRFQPATLRGEPVAIRVRIELDFVLR